MHRQSQHEGDWGEELVSQAVIEVVDQPLQAGDLPRGREPLRVEAAADVRQQGSGKLLLLENRQDL